jgi:tetratricopeptide (TPR) repeat protein
LLGIYDNGPANFVDLKKLVFILIPMLFLGEYGLIAQSARQYFKAGEEFHRTLNYEDAIEQYTKAIDLDPDLERAYINRAQVYAQMGDHELAARDFDRAQVFNKNDHELYYLSGKEWHLQGNNQIALAKINQAIMRKGNFLEAYQLRASLYMELEQYDNALDDYLKCIRLEDDEKGYYNLAQVYEKLEMYKEAEESYNKSIAKNKRIPDTYYSLSKLQYYLKKYEEALSSVNKMLDIEPANLEGKLLQSQILAAEGNFPLAIEVLSMASADFPEEPRIYSHRGDIYRMMNQAGNAIIDYTKSIDLDPDNAKLYFMRGETYEEIKQYDRALADYKRLMAITATNETANPLYQAASQKLFDLSREENKPTVVLIDPSPKDGNRVDVPEELQVINITGMVEDESGIQSLQVNGYTVPVEETGNGKQFLASVNLINTDMITVQVTDVYNNSETAIFSIRRTEVDPPDVQMIAPYSADGNILYLDSGEPRIYMEGRVEDESKIKSIYVDSVMASYIPDDLNPYFSALVNIENKRSITVQAMDEYGNLSETVFTLNREAQSFENNPMGKTWVVFIENSNYEYFPILEGPTKDIAMLQSSLNGYQVHNIVHMQNMTKEEMQRFFSIELRDMIRSNKINSILVWYAGHGKFINNTGYWIPVDATWDDEFSYYNIAQLKASMESYPDFLVHNLVVTDACESGPSFYRAMRSEIEERSCDDWTSTRLKSSQVFSSAGDESANDNSQFARTFSNVLANNPGNCLSIEAIVQKVSASMVNNNQQKPQFGKIAGLEDEDGSFFFIPKGY